VFTRGTDEYFVSVNSYWLKFNQEMSPACIVFPATAEDVSTTVSILDTARSLNMKGCQFAIRSGGYVCDVFSLSTHGSSREHSHGMQAGSSNAESAVTIDLRHINPIQVSEDRATTKVGPGVKLRTLYDLLDGMNLAVISGRDSNVGVAGLTLGGALSPKN
jgi:FAD/FMN-containing dehydrogenase